MKLPQLFFMIFSVCLASALSANIGMTGAAQASDETNLAAATPGQPAAPEPALQSFVIELDAPPLAEIYAEAQNDGGVQAAAIAALTQAHLADVEAAQQALVAELYANNIPVLYRTQRVFNGIAVRATQPQLAQIVQQGGVKAIYPLVAKRPDLNLSVPLIGTSLLWQGQALPPFTGEGIKIAIIDTGIDYFHRDFGGPGAGYSLNDRTVITDTAGVFPSVKVVDGYDFAGYDYDADPENKTYQPIPHPDSDPYDDCYGHGTHVAGIAAGVGVTSSGDSYTGTYDVNLSSQPLRIWPGVAPKALIYAYKVFGCTGSSEITDLAIERAVDPNGDGDLSDHVDVINMSLGSSYGAKIDVSTIAANNAAKIGVIVVASAGNTGDWHYVTGSPAIGEGVISVASSRTDILSAQTIVNVVSDFSSRGPRRGDSLLKPDLTAPGQWITSANAASGNGMTLKAGTSMAAPLVAGAMALLRQLHPDWSVAELKALVMNTASPVATSQFSAAPLSPNRIGAGRIELRSAITNSVLAFDAERPEAVSISFGAAQITQTTVLTRLIQIVNKGSITQNYQLSYASRIDMAGVTVELPVSQVQVEGGQSATIPVRLLLDPAAMRHLYNPTAPSNFDYVRFRLSEETGVINLTPLNSPTALALTLPVHAAPRPASDMRAATGMLDFGGEVVITQSLPLTGNSSALPVAPESYAPMVSAFELLYTSPNTPALAPIDQRVAIGDYNAADLQYIGVASNLTMTAAISNSRIYFGFVTYADWSSPNEMEISVLIDSDEDGADEIRLFNSDRSGYTDRYKTSDQLVLAFEDLTSKKRKILASLHEFGSLRVDNVPYNSNILVLSIPAAALGLNEDNSGFDFVVETKIEEIGGVIDRSPRLHWNLRQAGVAAINQNGSPFWNDMADVMLAVQFDAANYAASGGQGLLLLHHHNPPGKRSEIITIVNNPQRLYLPMVTQGQ